MLRLCLFFSLFMAAAAMTTMPTSSKTATTKLKNSSPTTMKPTTSRGTTMVPTTTACMDRVNPATGRSDCAGRANLCNNVFFSQLMTQECPRTCRRCNAAPTTMRPSTFLPASSRSSSMRPTTGRPTSMRPTTSRPTTGGPVTNACTDVINPQTGRSDCPNLRNLCNQPAFRSVMANSCPRICGICRQ